MHDLYNINVVLIFLDVQNGLRSKHRAPTLKEFKRRVNYLKYKNLYPQTIRSTFLEW